MQRHYGGLCASKFIVRCCYSLCMGETLYHTVYVDPLPYHCIPVGANC